MSRADWVVLNAGTQRFECGHCGETYKPTLPVSLSMFTAMGKEFLKHHRHCKERKVAKAVNP